MYSARRTRLGISTGARLHRGAPAASPRAFSTARVALAESPSSASAQKEKSVLPPYAPVGVAAALEASPSARE